MEHQENWLSRLRKGEKAIFEELYSYFNYCTISITKFGGSQAQAEDIFQEALIVLYQKSVQDGSFRLTSHVKTYLSSIVKRIWLSNRRRPGDSPLPLEENLPDEPIDLTDKDLAIKEWDEQKYIDSIAAIEKLPPQCQEILTAYYVEGLTLAEISDYLSIEKSSVKTRKSQCKKEWKNLLNSKK